MYTSKWEIACHVKINKPGQNAFETSAFLINFA